MKTKILILVLTCFVSLIYGQTYYPLVDNNNKVWKNLTILSSSQPPNYSNFRIYTYSSDSLVYINSMHYKKYILFAKYHSNNGWDDSTYTDTYYLREDSVESVYRIINPYCTVCGFSSTFEYKLYDFKLNINDTFQMFDCSGCSGGLPLYYNWVVINVDSIYIPNSFRKRLTLKEEGYNNTAIWIEGIGSLQSLTFSLFSHQYTFVENLSCYYENNQWVYSNPNIYLDSVTLSYLDDSCLIPLNISTLVAYNNKLYISNKILYLELFSEKTQTISIYNILGKCLLTQQVNGNIQIDLKSKGINDVLLFYMLTNEKELLKTGKLFNL